MDQITCISRARQLISKLNITTIPVDVAAIAAAQSFEIKESDLLADDEAGNTFIKNGRKIITVNKNDDPFRRRFTILHEIAHHVLGLPSKHGEKLVSSELERVGTRPPEEVLCDVFAAECLVPSHLIQPLTDQFPFTAATVQDLSNRFEASKQCVASRFARSSRDLLAYVFAENGTARIAITSNALRESGIWIGLSQLPKNSAAATAIKKGSFLETADIDASDWSSSDSAERFACYEEAMHMKKWEQTISLLTFEEITPRSSSINNRSEDDGLLAELTGHLPWPKR